MFCTGKQERPYTLYRKSRKTIPYILYRTTEKIICLVPEIKKHHTSCTRNEERRYVKKDNTSCTGDQERVYVLYRKSRRQYVLHRKSRNTILLYQKTRKTIHLEPNQERQYVLYQKSRKTMKTIRLVPWIQRDNMYRKLGKTCAHLVQEIKKDHNYVLNCLDVTHVRLTDH